VPLWIASGSGAAGRRILGTVVIVGMLAATLIAIFIIPVSFYVVERLSGAARKRTPGAAPEAPAPATGD
jgi:Cu/Ag efflux pump CusA